MGQIPQTFIDNLLSRINIVDVINARVPLKKKGSNYMACCPFHHEKTPSFSVNPSKQFYYCFGCGASGSAISFLMDYENLPFPDAIESLADTVGLAVPQTASSTSLNRYDALYALLSDTENYYREQLHKHPHAQEYLKHRGLNADTIERYGLGYSPDGWQRLEKHVTGATEKALLEAGLAIRHDSGRIYDRFRDRIMFPIRDQRGRTIAFGGRVLGQGEPKYLNSPETPLFSKGKELYGLFEARKYTKKLEQLIVVEGYMDVAALADHSIDHVVATLGTATTRDHIERLFRNAPEIIFCFDGDQAGRRAAWRGLENALPAMRDGREARFLFLPEGEDPDSLVRAQGKMQFEQQLSAAQPLADFFLSQLEAQSPTQSISGRARFSELAKPLLKNIPEGVYKSLLEQQVSAKVGLSIAGNKPRPAQTQRKATLGMTPMRMAITCLLQHPGLVESLPEPPVLPKDGPGSELLSDVFEQIRRNPEISTAMLIEHFRDTQSSAILQKLAGWRLPGGDEMDAESAMAHFTDSLHKIMLLDARSRSQALLSIAQERALTTEEKDELLQIHATLGRD